MEERNGPLPIEVQPQAGDLAWEEAELLDHCDVNLRMPVDVSSPELSPPWGAEAARASADPYEEGPSETFETASAMPADPVAPALMGMETPAERVRFPVPATFNLEGDDSFTDGSVINLSVTGLGAIAPLDVGIGERVWITFRLSLAKEPTSLLAEVVWRHHITGSHQALGLAFLGLTEAEADELRLAVMERVEGRAGAWPLPVMPSEGRSDSENRRASRWVAAAGGLVAGVILALLMALIPTRDLGPGESLEKTLPVVADVHDSNADDQVTSTSKQSGSKIVGKDDRTPERLEGSPDAMSERAHVARAEDPRSSARADVAVVTGRQPDPPKSKTGSADVLEPLGGPDRLTMALLTDGPVEEHVAFWLSHPRRLVVDIPDRQSSFARATYKLAHPLASKLRVGKHPGKVRFVIETSEDVLPKVEAERRDSSLVIELRRKG